MTEQAAILAKNLPGLGNPFALPIDVFDGAMRWLAEESQPIDESDNRAWVERESRRNRG